MTITKVAEAVALCAAAPDEASPHRDLPNFDPLARIYRWMEYFSFGPMLERCRFHFLGRCAKARRALVLGDGDGRFTACFLATDPEVHVDAVDSSGAMLAELRSRVQHKPVSAGMRLRTLHADLRSFTPDRGNYDLVVSHFFFDCLTDDELTRMVKRIIPHLTQDAMWLVSEFAIPKKGWRRACARLLVRFLYFAFDKMTHLHVQQIPNYARVLSHCGFRRQEQAQFLGGLLVAELWERKDR